MRGARPTACVGGVSIANYGGISAVWAVEAVSVLDEVILVAKVVVVLAYCSCWWC